MTYNVLLNLAQSVNSVQTSPWFAAVDIFVVIFECVTILHYIF